MFTTIVWGQTPPPDGEVEIELKDIILPPPPGPKSGTLIPINAWFNHELCMIRLETDAQQGPIVVSVEDEAGNLIFKEVVDGNQFTIKVHLISLMPGYYKLTLQSSTRLFVGRFEVY